MYSVCSRETIGLSMYESISMMRFTLSAESVRRMLRELISWLWTYLLPKWVMSLLTSSALMCTNSRTWETNWPFSGLKVSAPVSGSGKRVGGANFLSSDALTTCRNLSPLGSRTMSLRLRTCSMAMRYCSSSRGHSATERSVTFVSGEIPGAKIGVSPLRMA